MKPLTKKLVSVITAAAFTITLSAAMPSPSVEAQIIHWQHSEFDSWNNPNELPSSGSYLLESDVTLHSPIIVTEDLNLCLNGHNIIFKIAPNKDYPEDKTYGFFLSEEANLNIYAEESGGKIITLLCGDEDNAEEPAETTIPAEETEEPENTSPEEIGSEPDNTSSEDTAQGGEPQETEDSAQTTPAETSGEPDETDPAETAVPEETSSEAVEETSADDNGEASSETSTDGDEQSEENPEDTETENGSQSEEPAEITDTDQTASPENNTEASEENFEDNSKNNPEEQRKADDYSSEKALAIHIVSLRDFFKAEAETEEPIGNITENDMGTNGENKDETVISDPVLISHESSGALNLYGGVLETEGSVCIVSGINSSVNIYGGEVKAYGGSAAAICARGDIKINDGIVSGVEFDGGLLTVSGGKIDGGINVTGGNAVISGGIITGENALSAFSEKNAEITVCDNAVLAGDLSALNILNENARVYLYGEPVLEGNIYSVASDNAEDTVLSARCKDDEQKIYTGKALTILLPNSENNVFHGEIDGKYIITGVSGENKDRFAVSEEYYSLDLEEETLRLRSELIKITDIDLEGTAMEINTEITLTPAVSPENYFEKIIWSSSNPEIASVNESGTVSAHRVGTVTITAAAHTDGSIFASCEIEVTSSKVYGIVYDTKGVNAHIDEKYKHYVCGEITALPIPSAVGHSFIGWHRSSDLEDEIVTEIGAEESGDITLYAQWSIDDYSLEFILNGGEFESESNIPNSYTYGQEDVLPIPTREGFKFMGWYETEDFSDNACYKIPADSFGNKVYYARWVENDAKEYSVIFRVDGDISVVIVYEGEIPQYPNGVLSKASDDRYDYEFIGWSPEIVPANGFDVYEAQFDAVPKNFNISFSLNGGEMSEELNTYTYGDTVVLPIPIREGHSFQGWYCDEEFSGEAASEITANDYGDKVFFAKWAEGDPEENPDGETEKNDEVEISDKIIDVVWPANAKVILNPYKMKLAKSAASVENEIITDDVNGITDTVVSPELKFINKGSSEVKVVVTGSVNATTTTVDSDGMAFTYESRNIDFATAPIDYSDPNNTILLYLEQAYDIDPMGIGRYSQIFDSSNPRQMLLGRESITKEFFTIPASEGEEGTKANVKICGDMSVNPVLSWNKLAETDSVDINLVFTAVPVSAEKEENTDEDGEGETEEGQEPDADSTDKKEPDLPDEGSEDEGSDPEEPAQSGSDDGLNEPDKDDDNEGEEPKQDGDRSEADENTEQTTEGADIKDPDLNGLEEEKAN